MADETNGPGETPPAPRNDQAPPRPAPASPEPAAPGIEQRLVGLANDWLKTRLGLEERPDGALELPQRGALENIGQKADQFMRGFFRGFLEKTPEENEVKAGMRDPKNVPSATEIAGRLLSRASQAVTGAFHDYLKNEAAPAAAGAKPGNASAAGDAPVPIDGRFVLRHGAPLLGRVVQALGDAFSNPAEANHAPEAAVVPHDDPDSRVDYRVDLPSIMKSLVTGTAEPVPAAKPAEAAAPAPAPEPVAPAASDTAPASDKPPEGDGA